METLSIRKIEENYVYIGCMCVLYGVVFTFCLYKNLSGITFPIYVAATIITAVLFLKKLGIYVKKNFIIYAAGMMMLGISTVMTANFFFHFFNWAGILLLMMTAMIQQLNIDNRWSFQEYLVSILVLAGQTMISVCDPVIHGIHYQKNRAKGKESKYFKPILLGGVFAVGVLCIVLPLLVYSDQIFALFFGRFIQVFQFGTEAGIVLTSLLGTVMMYAFFSGLSRIAANNTPEEKAKSSGANINAVTGITFTAILAGIYVFYSAIQIIFLFLRFGGGLPENVTYSQYAHSGFWQLLAVSLINFVTVLICISIFEENKILKLILMIISICTCIMTFSAAYRMILYVKAYHLTFLRVLVLWFLGMLMLIMFGVMWSIFKRKFQLFKYIMSVAAICYIVLSFAKVDKVVAEYNVAHWNQISQEDFFQLMYGTSWDAAPVLAKAGEQVMDSDEWNKGEWQFGVTQYFQNILNEEPSIRSWNYSKASAREAAEEYLKKYSYGSEP